MKKGNIIHYSSVKQVNASAYCSRHRAIKFKKWAFDLHPITMGSLCSGIPEVKCPKCKGHEVKALRVHKAPRRIPKR